MMTMISCLRETQAKTNNILSRKKRKRQMQLSKKNWLTRREKWTSLLMKSFA